MRSYWAQLLWDKGQKDLGKVFPWAGPEVLRCRGKGWGAIYHLQLSLLPLTLSPGNHKRIQRGPPGFTFYPAFPKSWSQKWLL